MFLDGGCHGAWSSLLGVEQGECSTQVSGSMGQRVRFGFLRHGLVEPHIAGFDVPGDFLADRGSEHTVGDLEHVGSVVSWDGH